MLPYGMYLHKMYDHQKFTSVVKLKNTNLYQQRKNMIVEQADMIKDQRKKMQLAMVGEKRREAAAGKKKAEKHVPEVVTSAKFLMQEKKDSEKAAAKK